MRTRNGDCSHWQLFHIKHLAAYFQNGVRAWTRFATLFLIANILIFLVSQNEIRAADYFPNGIDWQKIVALAEKDNVAAEQSGLNSWKISKGAFQISGTMIDDPELTCYYATPEPKNGKGAPRRNDVVYYFHTPNPGDKDVLDNELCKRLVSESGMTVFGIAFVHSSSYSDVFDAEKRRHFYAFAQSGSFGAIREAWEQLRSRLMIDKDKFYVFGYSAGAIAGQRFCEEYPELCGGAVIANGHMFVQKRQAKCPFLILHTYEDGGVLEGDGLAAFYRTYGNAVTRLYLTPNWSLRDNGDGFSYHALNTEAMPLAALYLEGIADLERKAPAGTMADPTTWPYMIAAENPLIVVAAHVKDCQAAFRDKGLTATPIPSARFYREILKLPPPCQSVTTAKSGMVRVGRPPMLKPVSGIVAIWQKCNDLSLNMNELETLKILDLDLQYAGERGFIAFTAIRSTELEKCMMTALSLSDAKIKPMLVASVLFDPDPNDIAIGLGLNGLETMVVVLQENGNIDPYLSVFQRCAASGIRLKILVSCTNQTLYQAFLGPISHELREQYFSPFTGMGAVESISLHQQELEAAISYIEQGLKKAGR